MFVAFYIVSNQTEDIFVRAYIHEYVFDRRLMHEEVLRVETVF